MAARADVETHLGRRSDKITGTFTDWSADISTSDRVGVVEAYFAAANIGESGRLGTGTSIVAQHSRAPKGAPTVLVIGSHDTSRLARVGSNPTRPFDPTERRGPGVGSLLGPTIAFTEGFKAAIQAEKDEPVNMHFLSVGPGEKTGTNLTEMDLPDIDVVFCTNSIAWDPAHPTITTGSRGRLEVEITISAGQLISDSAVAGAVRNPLNKLTEILGSLRNDRGQIAIPDFYKRALPPRADERAEFTKDGFDPAAWISGLDVRRPGGKLSPLERSTMWPVISVLNVQTLDAAAGAMPASATASLAIYMVPDQRPVEIESSLKAWIAEQVPSDLSVVVTVTSSARPYRCSPDTPVVAAQSRAASRVQGRPALFVPGGGAIGAGEIHYATGAPVAFAGIIGPQHGYGSTDEALPRSLVDLGVRHAAETCLQLPRRTALRSTS